jgi:peptidoglycan-N-acetylglucosamine deacetylase
MHILTFDIEEWFHILDNPDTQNEHNWFGLESRIHANMDRIHSMLDKHAQKATFFCLGWVARKHPDIIKQIYKNGHQIGTHSDLHQLAYTQTQTQFEEDLKRSILALEQLIGEKIKLYRAPGFSFKKENRWVFESLHKFGIEIDASIFPALRSHGGFAEFEAAKPCFLNYNGITLKEFPINVLDLKLLTLIFSGGGYFRLLPDFLLQALFKNTDYVMTYFHPRDFDPEQPMVPGLNAIRKFKSYYGLKDAINKLDKLVENKHFTTIEEANQSIDWAKVKTISI